jgi:hypothetical protein
MPVPGYDPDDLDRKLGDLVTPEDLDRLLSTDERRRYDRGTGLVELLDAEEIKRLIDRENGQETE